MEDTLRGGDEKVAFVDGDLVYKISDIVAEEIDADICELPQIYDSIDTDALEAFLRFSNSLDTRPKRSVEFSYCGNRILIDSTGQVTLHREPGPPDSIPAVRGCD